MEIPLFPLRSVLFPGMTLPLRIFEERYRVMVRELLESGGMFGVVLIKEGEEVGGGAIPHNVGTMAVIDQCEEVEGGRFVLTAKGRQRFRLLEMLPPRPYPYGIVAPIEGTEPGNARRLERALETVRATFPAYFRLALSLTDQWAKGLQLPAGPHELVDFLGPWLQVDEEVKQRLLEIETASERVAYLAEVLDDLLGRTTVEVTEYRRRKFAGLGAQN
ncbi:MAG TPA: LON peptidase substrate-binding domain-containing protein [Tepidiformaceae bacterium]|nr:LON peptidase substrate-binding domain-containing protein [Tepidiformaceae bacterium]